MKTYNGLFLILCILLSACSHVPQSGKVIILNGPSAAGKTTLQKAIQAQANETYIALGIDNLFNDIFPDEYGSKVKIKADPATLRSIKSYKDESGKPVVELVIGETGQKIALGMNRAIAGYAKSGLNVVVDYIAYKPNWLDDLKAQLKGMDTYFIGVKIPLEVLEKREAERGTSPVGHARSHYNYVHKGWHYDLEVDISLLNADTAAKRILNMVGNYD